MSPHPFTPDDLLRLKERSLTPSELEKQIDLFKDPPLPIRLERPATEGDGIHVIADDWADKFTRQQGPAADEGRFVKFIPASGAATRMFDDLLRGEGVALLRFVEERRQFAFHEEWEKRLSARGTSVEQVLEKEGAAGAVHSIIGPDGLDLVHRPKALIPFHRYAGGSRTALEEQLAEASRIIRSKEGSCRIHLTVSPEHRDEFDAILPEMTTRMGALLGCSFKATCSAQPLSSETLAVDEDNQPFRDREGRLVFRPGGHGSLLKNLQRTGADMVFIKNIDNVVPDRLREPTIRWKKVLGGLLVFLQKRVHAFLRELEKGTPDPREVAEMKELCRRWFFRDPWSGGSSGPRDLLEWFHRPLRVCGMVRNTGEPGGGPYWVKGRDGSVTLQIVERAQVELADPEQEAIFKAATHFNPVDLVCGLRDHQDEPYDLGRFVDRDAVIISRKTLDGQTLKALEWPGLWNGAMQGWLTVLVEVPLETFDPVKTVFDLLRPRHRPE